MNKKNFIKGTTLPVALFFTIATFAPAWGLQTASAAIEVVQQQSTIKGTVVDSQGNPQGNYWIKHQFPLQVL